MLPRAWLLALCLPGCAPPFERATTPSGLACSDLPIVPAGQEPERPYHRLRPVASSPKASTEAARLDSLRREACRLRADAVIEAVNEEVRGDRGGYLLVASGTAIVWTGPAK